MKEYKQYHDEDGTFHYETQVMFSLANKNKDLSLNDLLKLTSDAAVEDYNQKGLSRDFLIDKGFGILVSRVSFKIHSWPVENEVIKLTTWEEKPEPLQLMRGYTIQNENGDTLIEGFSSWLLVNPEKRTIIPTKNFTLRNIPSIKKEHTCLKLGKINAPEEMTLIDERKIRFSDLDGNGHTNNARYGAFIVDALPEEWKNRKIKDFRINYSKEAMYGCTLKIYASIDSDNDKITVIGEHEEGKCFEAELYY